MKKGNVSELRQQRNVAMVDWPVVNKAIMHCKKSVDFKVQYLASGCQFFYRYFYGRLPVEHF